MDFSRTNATELGAALDRMGFTWERDDEGDISFRIRSSSLKGLSAASYKMVHDRSIVGQFLDAEVTANPDGSIRWEVPNGGPPLTAVVQNVVKIYLMPRPGQLVFQIHASVIPQNMEVAYPISIAPSEDQVAEIERVYPGISSRRENKNLWFFGATSAPNIDDAALSDFITHLDGIGRHMFIGSFDGWMRFPKL